MRSTAFSLQRKRRRELQAMSESLPLASPGNCRGARKPTRTTPPFGRLTPPGTRQSKSVYWLRILIITLNIRWQRVFRELPRDAGMDRDITYRPLDVRNTPLDFR